MTDWKEQKVIKGLELCKQDAKLCFSETECPYQCEFPKCCLKLMADALELLKEQGAEYEKGFNDAMQGKRELMYEGIDGKWHKKDW